jgi:hypothetical protein
MHFFRKKNLESAEFLILKKDLAILTGEIDLLKVQMGSIENQVRNAVKKLRVSRSQTETTETQDLYNGMLLPEHGNI